jgi:integrase
MSPTETIDTGRSGLPGSVLAHLDLCRVAPRRKRKVWPPRPSTGACPRPAASTDSPTSPPNRAQYLRHPKVYPPERRGLDRRDLGRFVFTAHCFDHAHAALALVLGLNGLRVSEACGADIENMASERGPQVLRIVGNGNKPALIPRGGCTPCCEKPPTRIGVGSQ